MTTDNELEGFAFGQHFTCACCGDKMTTVHKGLRRTGCESFVLPLAENYDAWTALVTTLKMLGFEDADLCGKCHRP